MGIRRRRAGYGRWSAGCSAGALVYYTHESSAGSAITALKRGRRGKVCVFRRSGADLASAAEDANVVRLFPALVCCVQRQTRLYRYGSTRLEVSPRDFVDRKSSAPFESAIVLDFFPNALALTFHLLPSKRGYVPRASASPGRRTLPLPSSPLPLPTVLANIATLLHASLLTARTCNTGPLQSLPGEVEMLARAAGEPITEGLEAERGLVDRLKKRLKRHHERRETMLGEEEVPDGALLIQPFRLEEFG